MGIRITKKQQAERTRRQILDAATRLFARRGFTQTTTQDLARAIGMTPGVMYWHFASKEDVLIAVLDGLERRLEAELADAGAQLAGADVGRTFEALIGRVAGVVERHQDNLLLVGVIGAEATDTNPRVERALRAAYGRIAGVVAALLRRASAEGLADTAVDVDCAAQMFLGLYMGGILHQRLFRREFPLRRALPVLRHLLVNALVPGTRRGEGEPPPRHR